MDTEARERALLRQIEELAQAADDDRQAADGAIVAAALGDVRAALGALRGDVGSLRADLSAARSGADSNSSRLSAALTQARAETEDLGRRHEQLAGRVDDLFDVVGDLRGLLTEVRNSLADQPSEIESVSAAVARVDENLGAKVDTLADDLRRTLNAGLTQATAGSRAAETSLAETRSVLEERLAAVEDTLDGLAERLEAIARDSISSNEDHLTRIERKVDEVSATALPEAVEAQEQWAHEIRAALGDLGRAVERSLVSLGTSLDEAVRATREDERAHIETLVSQLDRRIALTRDTAAASSAELRGFVESFQDATHTRLEEVRAALSGGLASAREELLAGLQGSLDALEVANGDSRRLVEDEVSSLRADLADALEEVRDRIAATVQVAQMGIVNAVEDQRASFDEIVRTLRADVLDRVEDSTATVRAGLDDLRAGVTTAARAGEESSRRLGEFTDTIESVDAAVNEMHSDWNRRTDAAIDLVAQAGHAAVDEFREEVRQVVDDLRASLDASTDAVDSSVDVVGTATARLVAAGQALLGYLARRDQVLEQERDRAIHEILDEFAQGLTAKERRGLSDRVGEALERRRDARDADRYRRTAAGEPLPEPPPVPEDLAALAEPVRPPRQLVIEPEPEVDEEPEQEQELPEPPRKTVAKKAAAKKAAKKATAKKTPAKKAAAKKTAAKRAPAKKAAAATAAPAAVAEPLEPPEPPAEVVAAELENPVATVEENSPLPEENGGQPTPPDDEGTDSANESEASTTEPLDGTGTTRV